MSTKLYEKIGLSPDETLVYNIIVSKFGRTLEELEIISGGELTPEAIANYSFPITKCI
ncbi:MAG: hypothetical protein ACW964_01480 [Candidatus Hodarchaeales archaeon]|jgi:hypothetical protein